MLLQRMAIKLGFEVVPRPSYQRVILCSFIGTEKGGMSSLKYGDEFGFDGQDAVTDSIPGLSDSLKLSGSTISADNDYALAA